MTDYITDLDNQISDLFDYVTDTALTDAFSSDLPFVGDAFTKNLVNADPFLGALKAQLLNALSGLAPGSSAALIASTITNIPGIDATAIGQKITIHIGAADTLNLAGAAFDLSVGSSALGFEVAGTAGLALGYSIDLSLVYDLDTQVLSTGLGDKDISLHLAGSFDVTGHGQLGFLGVSITDGLATPELTVDFSLDVADNKQISTLGAADISAIVSGSADLKLGLVTELPSDILPSISAELDVHYGIAAFDISNGLASLGATPDIALNNIQLDLGSFFDFLKGVFAPIIDDVFGSFPLGPLLDVLTTPIPIIDPATRALGLIDFFDKVGNDNLINLLDIAVAAGADAEIINKFAVAFNLIQGIKNAAGSPSALIDLGSVTLSGDAPASMSQMIGNQSAIIPTTVFTPAGTDPLAAVQSGLSGLGMSSNAPGLGGPLAPLVDALTSVGVSIPLLTDPGSIIPFLLNGIGGSPDVTLISYKVPELSFGAEYHQFFPIIGPIGVAIGGGLNASIGLNFGYDTHGITDLGASAGERFAEGFFFSTDKLASPVTIDGHTLDFAPVATVSVGIDAAAEVNIGFAEIDIGGGVGASLSAFFPGAEEKLNFVPDGKARLSDILSGCLFDPIAGQVNALLYIHFSIDFGIFSFEHRFDIADITLAEFSFGCDSPSTDPNHGLATLDTVDTDDNGIEYQLLINGGERADLHTINGQEGKDGSESFEIRNEHDADGIVLNSLVVTSRTVTDLPYTGAQNIDTIFARMGDARDVIVVAEDVTIKADIEGGDGDDLIVGGAGNDRLLGDDGFDHIIGGKGNDHIEGGAGDDLIEGGLGADYIDGGDDIDQATYENSKSGVTFKPDVDDHSIFHGHGGEAEGDTLTNIEYLIGSHFSDTLYTNPDENGVIEGLAGNDVLIGGSGDDYLLGGAGADALIGGSGEDGTSYLTSAGNVVVNLATGKGSGGDAQGDTFNSIEDVQGSAGDDVITGNSSDNVIDGWYGDDQISGGGGKDKLSGGAGNDTIFGDTNGRDELDGGGSRNNPGQDLLSYVHAAHGVVVDLYGESNPDADERFNDSGDDDVARALISSTKLEDGTYDNVYAAHISTFENLTGSYFDDALTGDDQYNTINGLAGADIIIAKGGNDTLIGGLGADYLDGGAGIDLADYRDSFAGVNVNLFLHSGAGGEAAGDFLTDIENLRGSDHSDQLFGDDGDNELDPGLTRSTVVDQVFGGGGLDTLVLDYSRGANLKGLVGGYDLGSSTDGSFVREENGSNAQLDGVIFNSIERLKITGTAHSDIIFGGLGNDYIATGSGNDLVFTGLGLDRVFAGKGNDIVVSGTDLNRQLSSFGGFAPTELVGGAGIDALSISLAASSENIVLTGTAGLVDFTGVNLALKNGTGISQFEVLLAVATGSGDDKVTQPGNFDNFFSTGLGVDEIRSGLGKDFVDGGLDYHLGSEIESPVSGTELTPVKSIDQLYANDGDLLVLDYSSLDTAVFGGVGSAQTGFTILDGSISRALQSNSGHYEDGAHSVDFVNIERLDVTGSSANDLLVGTDLLLGRNILSDGVLIGSQSKRGDDHLSGGDGNDLLIGNTGDDTLLGGKGDDVLVGAAVGSERGAVVDMGEIDILTGGEGADTFVLGTIIGDLKPIIYYNDGSGPLAGFASAGDHTNSGANHAIITDFTSEDFIQLAGIQSDYRAESDGIDTFIYLRDGVDAMGDAAPKNDELIAQLKGVLEFNLGAANVHYVGESAFAVHSGAPLTEIELNSAQARIVDLTDGRAQGIVDQLAQHATSLELLPEVRPVLSDGYLVKVVAAPIVLPDQAQANWVTQTDDTTILRDALFGSSSALSGGKLTIDGDASAFGTFDGDPFGLGHGIVISTGAVEDLAGVNLIDGGGQLGPVKELTFVKIGRVGNNDIFRADLTNLGFDLNSIKLGDQSSGFGGGGGVASGFDISAVVLSNTRLNNLTDANDLNDSAFLSQINAFSFDAANAHFDPGQQRVSDANFGNAPDLLGSINGLPIYQFATLDTFDDGFLTLGDGGSLGFNLTQTVSTSGPLYLYVAENGASGEVLTTGFTASSNRLDTPADLSTDLGAPGVEGDNISLTYRFNPSDTAHPDPSLTKVTFDFVFFSEELVEYAQSEFNDNFKITLNGVNLALLTDGSTASINTLYTPNASGSAFSSIYNLREDTISSDFIYNSVGTGPAASQTRADGFSKVLHFTGDIIPGVENVLKIEVNDVRDGLLDSGILVRGGSFVGTSSNAFHIDQLTLPVGEGEHQDINFGLTIPSGNHDANPVTVTFHPTDGLDLGAGAGQDVTRVLDPNGKFFDVLTVVPVFDGVESGHRYETISVDLTSRSAVQDVAPLVIEVAEVTVAIERTLGNAPMRNTASNPNAWADAWTASGIVITHTDDSNAAVPVYSAVDLGQAHRNLLSGADIFRGDLGVSGRAKGSPGSVQDISGNEALRFDFASHNVSDIAIVFDRFEPGDVAQIELLDASGQRIRAYATSEATFTLSDHPGTASIIISAAIGGFTVHSLTVTEQVDPLVAVQLGYISGTAAADTLSGTSLGNTIHGLGGNDHLYGLDGTDQLYGDGGNDVLNGGRGDDLLDGGAGVDTADYSDAGASVNVSLAFAGAQATGGAGTDTLISIENLTGSQFVDKLTGDGFDNVLQGLSGKDWLYGGDGNDTLNGGANADMLIGGAGNDIFLFDTLGTSSDRDMVKDFTVGSDLVEFSRAGFAGFAGHALGSLTNADIAFGKYATTSSQHLVYNAAKGNLYYDPDGAGGVAQIQIAHFVGNPLLDLGDFGLI